MPRNRSFDDDFDLILTNNGICMWLIPALVRSAVVVQGKAHADWVLENMKTCEQPA